MHIDVKINYIVFTVITIFVSLVSKFFTSSGMQWYYNDLKIPSYTPPGWFIGSVWMLIYILTTLAVIMVWNNVIRDKFFYLIMGLFALSTLCNLCWTYLFFYQHNICLAFADSLLLLGTLLTLLFFIVKQSLITALLLLPYVVWILFATWLNAMIMFMN